MAVITLLSGTLAFCVTRFAHPLRAAQKEEPAPGEPSPEPKRRPIPDKEAQVKVLKVIKDLYKADYAKRKPEDLLELAAKLLQEAADTKGDPTVRFVLLREARDVAAQAGNTAMCLEAVSLIAKEYDIDALGMKVDALAAASAAAARAASPSVAEACLALLDEALAGDDYETALRLVSVAADAARKARSVPLAGKAEARRKEVQTLQKEFLGVKEARAKLRKMPDDPDASLAVGKYLCLIKGDWKEGLALLAQAGDRAFKAVAEQERAKPTEAEDQVRVGDAWWDLAAKATGRAKTQMQARALYWYEQAVPQLKGLAQARLEKRIQEAAAIVQPWMRLTPGGFGGRTGDVREQLLRDGGGTKQSEAAVALGLQWLAKHQERDGHWSLDGFNHRAGCTCTGPGAKYDIAATALGLLPFLGTGETHLGARPHTNIVNKGLNYLISRQQKDGSFSANMYEHGLATIAMCEAYGLTGDARLKPHAQAGLNYIAHAQSDAGSWRYGAGQQGLDTSIGGWQLMALKSGQMAGLNVPKEILTRADRGLDAVMDQASFGYGYASSGTGVTTTAVALLCRQYRGWGPKTPQLAEGIKIVEANPPNWGNVYYCYYATQVMHHMGGERWQQWNEGTDAKGNRIHQGMRDLLIAKQDKDPTMHSCGSWNPAGDVHGAAGGRIMVTSLSLLTLEVYYRHVPLYGRDKGKAR
jgi:hypothetical protein